MTQLTLAAGQPADNTIRLPLNRTWEVTAWARPTRPDVPVYRLYRDGLVMPTADAGPDTGATMISPSRAAQLVDNGVLVPAAVSALAPALKELRRFRVHSEYLEGPPDCLEGDCEHPDGDCPDVRRVLATTADAHRLHRIQELVNNIDPDPEGDHDELTQLRDLVTALRSAINDDLD